MGHDANEYHPIDIIHDRHGLYGKIYRSRQRCGDVYSIEFNRMGRFEGKQEVIYSFRPQHLRTLARLARRCHDRVMELKHN